jgi:proteasome accessory factor C
MKDRTERLLVLLPWLVANPNAKPLEISKHFNISPKQLFEDLALLTFTGPGEYGGELVDIQYDEFGINVVDHQGLDKPIQFTNAQKHLIILGLMTLLEFLSPDEQIKANNLIKKLDADLITVATDSVIEGESKTLISYIYDCIQSESVINFTYKGTFDKDSKFREISPLKIIYQNNNYYVEGYCHSACGARTFKLTRMINVIKNDNIEFKDLSSNFSTDHKKNYYVVSHVSSKNIEKVASLPGFKIVENLGDILVCNSIAYNYEFILKMGLMYRDSMRIIEPPEVEAKISQIISSFLETC